MNITIRWADDTKQLVQRLHEGMNVIDATRASAEKMAKALSGDQLIAAAHKIVAGIQEIGGATKLTTAESERYVTTLDKAIEKYAKLGKVAPDALKETAAALHQTASGGKATEEAIGSISEGAKEMGANLVGAVAGGQILVQLANQLVATGKEVLHFAAQFDDLSKATGISIRGLQELNFVGVQFGVESGEMIRGVENLSERLASGDQSAVAAVQKLGLSIKTLLSVGPQEAFLRVAEATGRVEDPMQRAAIAADLFGAKLSKTLLPALGEIRGKMAEAGDAGAIMSDRLVKQADAFDDAWERTKIKFKATAASILGAMADLAAGRTIGAEGQVTGGPPEPARTISPAGAERGGLSQQQIEANVIAGWKAEAAAIQALTAADKAHIEQGLALKKSVQDIASAFKLNVSAVQAYKDAQEKAAEATKKARQEAEAYAKTWQKADDNLRGLGIVDSEFWDGTIEGALKMGASVHDLSIWFDVSEGSIEAAANQMETWSKIVKLQATPSAEELARVLDNLGTKIPQKEFEQTAAMLRHLSDLDREFTTGVLPSYIDNLGVRLSVIDPQMERTIALHKEWQKQVDELASDFAKMAQIAGGSFSSILRGVGGVVAGISTISKSLDSLRAARASGSKLGQFTGALGIFGGLFDIGASIFQALRGIGGPNEAQKNARSQQEELIQQLRSIATQGQITAGALTTNYKTIAIVGGDALRQVGKSAKETDLILQGLLDTEHPQRFAAALLEVQRALGLQEKSQQALTDALSRYHFTEEQLGPALQRQHLHEQFQQLYQDFQILTGAGVDITAVTEQMSADMSAYVQLAKRTGTEIPEAMKPVLQNFIDQGQLFDENGNKITDLNDAGLTFAATMGDVVDAVKELTNVLRRGLGLAIDDVTDKINKIPRDINVDVNVNTTGGGFPGDQQIQLPGDYGATGGLVTSAGIMPDYLSEAPTIWPSRGGDTVPAMLSPGERVLSAPQNRSLEAAISSMSTGSGQPIVVQVMMDGQIVAETTVKKIAEDKRGVRTRAQRALGMANA